MDPGGMRREILPSIAAAFAFPCVDHLRQPFSAKQGSQARFIGPLQTRSLALQAAHCILGRVSYASRTGISGELTGSS